MTPDTFRLHDPCRTPDTFRTCQAFLETWESHELWGHVFLPNRRKKKKVSRAP